jgi:aminoglycoside phosphotransferase family enzyme
MKEFNQAWLLQHRISTGSVTDADFAELGRQLAGFHQKKCESSESISHFGMPYELSVAFDQNYVQTEQFVGTLQSRQQLDDTKSQTNSFFFNRSNVLIDRVRSGKIKKCHVRLPRFCSRADSRTYLLHFQNRETFT